MTDLFVTLNPLAFQYQLRAAMREGLEPEERNVVDEQRDRELEDYLGALQKQVDDGLSEDTANLLYVKVPGDTMTGALIIESPYTVEHPNALHVPTGGGRVQLDGTVMFGHIGESPSAPGEVWFYRNVYVENGANVELSGGGDLRLSGGSELFLYSGNIYLSGMSGQADIVGQDINTIELGRIRFGSTGPQLRAVTGKQVDVWVGSAQKLIITGTQAQLTVPLVMQGDINMQPGTGIILPATEPSASNRATSKTYVDTADALRLALAGGTMTGPITLAADPAAAMQAATKQYVDSKVGAPPDWTAGYPTYDPRYVNVTGDTMTGPLTITGAGINVNGALFASASGTPITFYEDGGALFKNGVNIAAILKLTGTDNENLRMVENAGGYAYLAYFNAAQTARKGYIGYPGVSHLYVRNEVASASIFLQTDNAAVFMLGGSETARIDPSWFLIGKTANDQTVAGYQGNRNAWCQTSDVTTASAAVNKTGAGNANGCVFHEFRRGTNVIGSITSPSAGVTAFNTSSDYRLKDDHGPLRNSLNRVIGLAPRRVVFRDDADQREIDGFFAHEVAKCVPEAVTGAKDAVDDQGAIVAQQLDQSKLVPLLTAAIIELRELVVEQREQIDDLRERVAFLSDQIGEFR